MFNQPRCRCEVGYRTVLATHDPSRLPSMGAARTMQVSTSSLSRVVLLATLTACGFSVWLAYRLGVSNSNKRIREEHLKAAITVASAPTATVTATDAAALELIDEVANGQERQGQSHEQRHQQAGQQRLETVEEDGPAAQVKVDDKDQHPQLFTPHVQHQQEHQDSAAAVASCKSCQELIGIYERVGKGFATGGLDIPTIKAIQPWFFGLQGNETPWPRSYEQFQQPLPKHSVRLLVVPLEDAPTVAAAAAAITRDMLALLPEGTKYFCNARTNYHCTVFHTSHPTDTRPDPFHTSGGLPANPGPPHTRPGPSKDLLDAETEAVTRVVKASKPPHLVLDRVVMANSGTLLITWVDPSGHVAEMRQRMRTTFPGACAKQASIIHTSLLRLLSDEQLSGETVKAVAELCARWTQKLRGKVLVPSATWWVDEHEFSTIVGDRVRIRFGAQ